MDNEPLDLELLPASDYNSIKSFEEQQTITSSHLGAIAEIYVRARMHHSYGAGILHRHFALRKGDVMVHTRCENDVDLCTAENLENLDRHSLRPHSFLLNSKGRFQAYEYDTGLGHLRPLPDTAFLHQLRDFLVENQLTSLVAILAEDNRQDSVEFLLPDRQGMICVPRQDSDGGSDGVGPSVITGWKFFESDGRIECRARRACESQGDGQHKVKSDSVGN
ncbi:hypothetical protein DL98DRAFT_504276 [Cadophora sp. DSE1049]|nr:hypothetical protein DL98DRAFT_504276 [Cadophora sp. DSE1049]